MAIREKLVTNEELLQEVRELKQAILFKEILLTKEKPMRAETIAEYFDISLQTLRDWTSDGRIPHHKLGKTVFYYVSEILQSTIKNKVAV